MSRIDDILHQQARDLEAMKAAEVARAMRALQDARRAIAEHLSMLRATGGDRVQRFTTQSLLISQAQTEAAIRQLVLRLTGEQTAAAMPIGERALRDMLRLIRANEPGFVDAGGQVEWRALNRISRDQGLLLHRYSYERYGAELIASIQRELAAGVVRSLTIPQMTARVAGTSGSVFSGMEHRAELIVRMESSKAYNDMHHQAMEEAAAVTDIPGDGDPLMRQADEVFDRRNHPFSRAIHGMTTALNKPWRVPVSRVQAAAESLGIKRVGGIVWPVEGGEYVVGGYPCHFGERGRAIPFRASWSQAPQMETEAEWRRAA